MYCLWIDLEICGDCEFEASTCASLALSWWGGAWLEMAWSLCFLAEKLVNIWWTLRLKCDSNVGFWWFYAVRRSTFRLSAPRPKLGLCPFSSEFLSIRTTIKEALCFILESHNWHCAKNWHRDYCKLVTTQTLPPATAKLLAHFSFEYELVRQNQGSLRRCRLKCEAGLWLPTCFSAACSVSSATSLGLRIFRNSPTFLNQAEFKRCWCLMLLCCAPLNFLPFCAKAEAWLVSVLVRVFYRYGRPTLIVWTSTIQRYAVGW